jgi:rusticyanin
MKHLIGIGLLLILVGLVGLSITGFLLANSSAQFNGQGTPFSAMPGGGNMGMNGEMPVNSNATVTTPEAIQQQVQQLAPDLHINTATNQIRYSTQQVTLVMVGAPPGHPGEYWQADGLVNPTIVIPTGATVKVIFANGDGDKIHAWELTTSAPPYPVAPMMTVGVAASNAFLAPIPAATSNGHQWSTESTTFAAPSPGTYYYICQVPGHAEEGMWGKLIVQ